MLELININKTYEKKVQALKKINLTFSQTGFVSIVGPSGCGKTTLLNIIGGLDSYTSGELKIDNVSTRQYKEKDWDYYRGNKIGFVFQNYNLIPHLTVYENIKTAISLQGNKDYHNIIDALDKVGLINHKDKYTRQLSGGETQRVAIARAIVNKPSIILADEPTGALDSKTSLLIMKILKEISNNCLVIMVTHNEILANEYSNRIIRLIDGEVVNDSKPINEHKNDISKNNKKTSISIFTAIKLSIKNLINKKVKTSLMIIAGLIGIIGLCLVLIFSNIVSNYMEELQKNTLSNSPITIRSTVSYDDPYKEDVKYPAFPNNKVINITNLYTNYYSHVNKFDEDFLNYMQGINNEFYNIIDYRTALDLKILTVMDNNIKRVYPTRFNEVSDDIDYLKTQYDILAGDFPTKVDEIAILVDRYNNIDISVLDSLGIDFLNRDSYTFEEIMKKEYKVILNNDAYIKTETGLYTNLFRNENYQTLYDKSNTVLKISGILRISSQSTTSIYDNGILYSRKLTDYIVSDSNLSEIVKEQKAYGLDKNVLTGQPFTDQKNLYSTITKEYQYESLLGNLCAHPEISTIRIYTNMFRYRVLINDYLNEYNKNVSEEKQIRYSDYMGNITREFDVFINVLTNILIAFAAIALFVATIMVGIITYISVVERIKEIGILRSLGARRIDIGLLFIVETSLIGFVSGILGVIGGLVLLKPIINLITKVMKNNNITTFDLSLLNLNQFNKGYLVLIVAGSVFLMLFAGLIPALIAANKKPVEAIKHE